MVLGLGSLVIAVLCVANQGARDLLGDLLGRSPSDGDEPDARIGSADSARHA
jgi:hypothetical protein